MPWQRLCGHQHAHGCQCQAAGNQCAQTQPVRPQTTEDGAGQGAGEEHRGQQAAFQRAVAGHPLKALRDAQQHATGGEGDRYGTQHTGGKGPVAKQRKIQQRMCQAVLPVHEGGRCRSAHAQCCSHYRQIQWWMGQRLDDQHQG